MKRFSIATMSVFFLAVLVGADPSHPPAASPASPEFERIKQLAGIWNGTAKSGKEKKQDATVIYQITSGGQAVTETLFPGTPHEMVSVYYDQDGKMMMTHYCVLPNRPVMGVKKATPKQIDLDTNPSFSGFSAADPHMHSLSLTWKGPDKLTQKWTSWKNGKAGDSTIVILSRVR